MKLTNRIYGLLALLFMGSASLQAQDSDPFGGFNPRLYQNNMTVTAQVVQNGQMITNGIVAVYCGTDLRGKNNIGNDPDNPSLVYLQVYGNSTGTNNQYLHFKVYTDEHVFTFTPDPAITWNNDGYGSTAKPYLITLPLSLPKNNDDNSIVLTDFAGHTCDVTLTGRTLFKDGSWNTLCLPFSLSSLTGTVLQGAAVKTLESTEFDKETGVLTLNFSTDNLTAIEAGKPYIVKWTTSGDDLTDPLFTGVEISTAPANVTTDYVDFTGTYDRVDIFTTAKTNLYLGPNNTLYYPWADGMKHFYLNAFLAYFHLKGITAGASVRSFNINYGEEHTGIVDAETNTSLSTLRSSHSACYDLSGRRINGKPTAKGIYIIDGKQVVIK